MSLYTRNDAAGCRCTAAAAKRKSARAPLGDGTLTVVQECTAKDRSEPVDDTRGPFTIDRWREIRTNGGTARCSSLNGLCVTRLPRTTR